MVRADERAEEELSALALEGLNTGTAMEVGPDYWQDKHRRLDERLKKRYLIRPKADVDLELQALYLAEKASPVLDGVDILRVIHGSQDLTTLLRREGIE
jgi:hypothetical protein